MIKILGNEVIVEQDSNMEYSKFLWETLELMTNRFVILAFNRKKSKVSYDKMEKMKFGSDEILIMQCESYSDFAKAINELSENLIFESYITVNSSLKTVKSAIEDRGDFDIEWYMENFPKTIHIEETGFKINLDTFSTYAFQIERIVKRFGQ